MELHYKALFVGLILSLIEVSTAIDYYTECTNVEKERHICPICPNPLEMVVSGFAGLLLLSVTALMLACFHCCRLPKGRSVKETTCVTVSPQCPPPPTCTPRRCGTPIKRSVFVRQ